MRANSQFEQWLERRKQARRMAANEAKISAKIGPERMLMGADLSGATRLHWPLVYTVHFGVDKAAKESGTGRPNWIGS